MISENELNPNNYPMDSETRNNFKDLLAKLNAIRALYGKPMIINSGLRSQADQQRINPSAPKSKHITGQAADIRDKDGIFWAWCLNNLKTLAEIGIWLEARESTPTWVHCQTAPPKSGNRIFIP